MSSHFDDLDRALATGLSALAPEVVGADDALVAMRPGFQRARTRRRVVKAGASLAALLVVGSVGVLAAPRSTRSHVSVSSPPTTTAHTLPRVKHTTTSKPQGTVAKSTTTTAPPVVISPPTGGSHRPGNTSPTVPVTSPMTTPVTAPNGGGPGTTAGGGHGHDDGSTTTSTTVPASKVETYMSPGGNIVVRQTNTTIELLRVDRHPGYYREINASGPHHIDVRFLQNGHEKYRIILDIKNGKVVRSEHDEISRHGPSSTTVPVPAPVPGPGPGSGSGPGSGESPPPGPGSEPQDG